MPPWAEIRGLRSVGLHMCILLNLYAAIKYQFGQTPNSAVFRYRKSRVVELPNLEVFVLFPLLASVCYNVWNSECLENLWGEYVRKWLNLLKIDDNSWQSKRITPLLAYACRKGKEYENFRIRKFNDPKTSDIGRLPNSGFARTDINKAESDQISAT